MQAAPLAIHILGRPLSEWEPIERDDLLSMLKLKCEGRLEEVKIATGWEINTRLFIV